MLLLFRITAIALRQGFNNITLLQFPCVSVIMVLGPFSKRLQRVLVSLFSSLLHEKLCPDTGLITSLCSGKEPALFAKVDRPTSGTLMHI